MLAVLKLDVPDSVSSACGKAMGNENRGVVLIPLLRSSPGPAGVFRLREGNVDHTASRSRSTREIRGRGHRNLLGIGSDEIGLVGRV